MLIQNKVDGIKKILGSTLILFIMTSIQNFKSLSKKKIEIEMQ